ncbi:hypothetical protein M409DRAFT_56063 [Zasmidium cellare ATCC 36951]|uniref:Uncharacterized protein n=1 Tax=Zasmidium cellare ATCC 36951 TaxID=1080233 RepID=A0A6A6CDL1_ZASCE|nr:uncharacterized protein M409DRAFT_56063 [Zasmidium cellare ATCC 36951]KAF2165185.1 hypothetical protein M409DRAFT_56063 [Zasmidium cellare ATCC 36951]
MAAVLLVLGAVAIKERVEKKKAAKRMVDDLRYQELQAETERRLSLGRMESEGTVEGERGEGDGEGEEGEELPTYEQVVRSTSGRSGEGGAEERGKGKESRRRSVRKLLRFGRPNVLDEADDWTCFHGRASKTNLINQQTTGSEKCVTEKRSSSSRPPSRGTLHAQTQVQKTRLTHTKHKDTLPNIPPSSHALEPALSSGCAVDLSMDPVGLNLVHTCTAHSPVLHLITCMRDEVRLLLLRWMDGWMEG